MSYVLNYVQILSLEAGEEANLKLLDTDSTSDNIEPFVIPRIVYHLRVINTLLIYTYLLFTQLLDIILRGAVGRHWT